MVGPCQISLEDHSPEHGKGPLSLERAELLQKEGNLALSLYGGQAWLGLGWERGPEGEPCFLRRNCGPRRTWAPKGSSELE